MMQHTFIQLCHASALTICYNCTVLTQTSYVSYQSSVAYSLDFTHEDKTNTFRPDLNYHAGFILLKHTAAFSNQRHSQMSNAATSHLNV